MIMSGLYSSDGQYAIVGIVVAGDTLSCIVGVV